MSSMKKAQFTDSVALQDVSTHKDGYKIVRGRIARTGLQGYLRHELGDAAPVGNPNDVMQIYRPDDEVFNDASLNGWAHVPVTLDHPPELVTPENVSKYGRGEVTSKARLDRAAGWLELEWVVKDADAIAALDATHKEVSGGYTADIDFTAGVTPDGRNYDGVQRGITPNHLALVPKGRAFSDAATAAQWGATPQPQKEKPMDMKSIVIGDAAFSVPLSDADKIEAAVAGLKQEIADRDAAIGEHMANIKNLEAKQLTDADVEAKAIERASVVDRARQFVADMAVEGKGILDIKREALASMFDAAKVADFPEPAVTTMFDTLEPVKVDDSAREMIKVAKKEKQKKTGGVDEVLARYKKKEGK